MPLPLPEAARRLEEAKKRFEQCENDFRAIKSPQEAYDEEVAAVKDAIHVAYTEVLKGATDPDEPSALDKIVLLGGKLKELELKFEATIERDQKEYEEKLNAVLRTLGREIVEVLGPSLPEQQKTQKAAGQGASRVRKGTQAESPSEDPRPRAKRRRTTREVHEADDDFVSSVEPTQVDTPLSSRKRRHKEAEGITEPIPGEIYLAYRQKNKSWAAVLLLPTENLQDIGVQGSLEMFGLTENLPGCYTYNLRTRKFKWRPGYEDGGPLVSQREFPVIHFDDKIFPEKSTVGWIAAANLQKFDMGVHKAVIPHYKTVAKYLKKHGKTVNGVDEDDLDDEGDHAQGQGPEKAQAQQNGNQGTAQDKQAWSGNGEKSQAEQVGGNRNVNGLDHRAEGEDEEEGAVDESIVPQCVPLPTNHASPVNSDRDEGDMIVCYHEDDAAQEDPEEGEAETRVAEEREAAERAAAEQLDADAEERAVSKTTATVADAAETDPESHMMICDDDAEVEPLERRIEEIDASKREESPDAPWGEWERLLSEAPTEIPAVAPMDTGSDALAESRAEAPEETAVQPEEAIFEVSDETRPQILEDTGTKAPEETRTEVPEEEMSEALRVTQIEAPHEEAIGAHIEPSAAADESPLEQRPESQMPESLAEDCLQEALETTTPELDQADEGSEQSASNSERHPTDEPAPTTAQTTTENTPSDPVPANGTIATLPRPRANPRKLKRADWMRSYKVTMKMGMEGLAKEIRKAMNENASLKDDDEAMDEDAALDEKHPVMHDDARMKEDQEAMGEDATFKKSQSPSQRQTPLEGPVPLKHTEQTRSPDATPSPRIEPEGQTQVGSSLSTAASPPETQAKPDLDVSGRRQKSPAESKLDVSERRKESIAEPDNASEHLRESQAEPDDIPEHPQQAQAECPPVAQPESSLDTSEYRQKSPAEPNLDIPESHQETNADGGNVSESCEKTQAEPNRTSEHPQETQVERSPEMRPEPNLGISECRHQQSQEEPNDIPEHHQGMQVEPSPEMQDQPNLAVPERRQEMQAELNLDIPEHPQETQVERPSEMQPRPNLDVQAELNNISENPQTPQVEAIQTAHAQVERIESNPPESPAPPQIRDVFGRLPPLHRPDAFVTRRPSPVVIDLTLSPSPSPPPQRRPSPSPVPSHHSPALAPVLSPPHSQAMYNLPPMRTLPDRDSQHLQVREEHVGVGQAMWGPGARRNSMAPPQIPQRDVLQRKTSMPELSLATGSRNVGLGIHEPQQAMMSPQVCMQSPQLGMVSPSGGMVAPGLGIAQPPQPQMNIPEGMASFSDMRTIPGLQSLGSAPGGFSPQQGIMSPQIGMASPNWGTMSSRGMASPQMGMPSPQLATPNLGMLNQGMSSQGGFQPHNSSASRSMAFSQQPTGQPQTTGVVSSYQGMPWPSPQQGGITPHDSSQYQSMPSTQHGDFQTPTPNPDPVPQPSSNKRYTLLRPPRKRTPPTEEELRHWPRFLSANVLRRIRDFASRKRISWQPHGFWDGKFWVCPFCPSGNKKYVKQGMFCNHLNEMHWDCWS